MTIADRDGQPRSAFVQQQFGKPDAALAQGAVAIASSSASSASRRRRTAWRRRRADVQRHRDRLGDGARPRARRAVRAAAGRARHGHRRRRHVGRRRSTSRSRASRRARSRSSRSASARSASRTTSRSTRVETPRTVLKGTSLVVDVVITPDRLRRPDRAAQRRGRGAHRQHAGRDAAGATASRRPCACASRPPTRGRALFRFRVAPQDGEQVTQNNVRDALIEVRRPAGEGAVLRGRAAASR